MNDPAKALYKEIARCLVFLFDLRRPGALQRLRRELSAWRGRARVEKPDDGYVALVVRPGGATR
jgi:hypothetical protein